jgi:hypothetical protein
MAKRLRRFSLTVDGVAVTGARDWKCKDKSEYNRDKADNEAVGDEVRMGEGPWDVSFEMLASHAAVKAGYIGTCVAVVSEVERSSGTAETVVSKTYSCAQGHFNVDLDANTDSPGRIPVTGEFKTCVIT